MGNVFDIEKKVSKAIESSDAKKTTLKVRIENAKSVMDANDLIMQECVDSGDAERYSVAKTTKAKAFDEIELCEKMIENIPSPMNNKEIRGTAEEIRTIQKKAIEAATSDIEKAVKTIMSTSENLHLIMDTGNRILEVVSSFPSAEGVQFSGYSDGNGLMLFLNKLQFTCADFMKRRNS